LKTGEDASPPWVRISPLPPDFPNDPLRVVFHFQTRPVKRTL